MVLVALDITLAKQDLVLLLHLLTHQAEVTALQEMQVLTQVVVVVEWLFL